MPAATHHDDGAVAAEQPQSAVTDHLDRALEVARDQEMSASELMGLFFYYAHSIAESYRADALERDR